MACHPDLVIRSKANASTFLGEDAGEATVCRICNDVAEDAIQSKCRHIFDRECIKQYLNTALEQNVRPDLKRPRCITETAILCSRLVPCAMFPLQSTLKRPL